MEEFGISQVNSHHEEANRAMNDMQPLLEALLRNTSQIKWILATILMFLMLAATGLTALIIKLNKMSDELGKKHNFSDVARDLLDKDDLEQVIKLALERLSKYPKDRHAYWFLAQAYYRQADWVKSLQQFKLLYEIAPDWRGEYVDPYMEDLKERLSNSKPELVKD